jgi:hypothetical protein
MLISTRARFFSMGLDEIINDHNDEDEYKYNDDDFEKQPTAKNNNGIIIVFLFFSFSHIIFYSLARERDFPATVRE